MTTYKRGDIVLVPFPLADVEGEKKRPALVLSANWFNASHQYVIAGLTTSIRTPIGRDEVLLIGRVATDAGLPKEGVVKAGKLYTIETPRIIRRLGTLSHGMVEQVLQKTRDILA